MAENVDNVLYLRDRHISNNIASNDMDVVISPRRSDKSLWTVVRNGIHLRVLLRLAQMGFYGVIQCGPIKYFDNHLITVLVERWRQETHTFHLPVGEATITLQDVAMIWGLNIDGLAVIGRDISYSKSELLQRCTRLLGFTPEANRIKGAHLYRLL
ncbi:serine/threonine-protein phosphatase 7 long form [Dorcoceras hygrometricum]|uniref:Serine/threonine-protein phosphatase 7 long form n=1 Tax=Dorcoceras hygrometricum TaxID=472368 RepID=A0A2Z7ABU1_9LAMI|nr:serine/threonine-protein phosphatase 7 long form [Dorcoceras hygrometricum]